MFLSGPSEMFSIVEAVASPQGEKKKKKARMCNVCQYYQSPAHLISSHRSHGRIVVQSALSHSKHGAASEQMSRNKILARLV